MILRSTTGPAPSLAHTRDDRRAPLRVGLVQHEWVDDPEALQAQLSDGIARAAAARARVVFLPELTLSKYPADVPAPDTAADSAEHLPTGPTYRFAAAAARSHGICVQASLYERADRADGLGYNTAILVAPTGELVGRTRKLHIPVTTGYYENTYFHPGPSENAYPVYRVDDLDGVQVGLPTCWDQWFPEVARIYSLRGAEVLAFPSAIGSEPDFPGFDTQPQWQQVIVAGGIANGTFMVVPNRCGDEGRLRFYGSSFISDPYGRVLVQAPRDEPAVLVADLDLDQRREWLDLFPFLRHRRPDTYDRLIRPVDKAEPYGDTSETG